MDPPVLSRAAPYVAKNVANFYSWPRYNLADHGIPEIAWNFSTPFQGFSLAVAPAQDPPPGSASQLTDYARGGSYLHGRIGEWHR